MPARGHRRNSSPDSDYLSSQNPRRRYSTITGRREDDYINKEHHHHQGRRRSSGHPNNEYTNPEHHHYQAGHERRNSSGLRPPDRIKVYRHSRDGRGSYPPPPEHHHHTNWMPAPRFEETERRHRVSEYDRPPRQEKIEVIIKQPPPQSIKYPPQQYQPQQYQPQQNPQQQQRGQVQIIPVPVPQLIYPPEHSHFLRRNSSTGEPLVKKRRQSSSKSLISPRRKSVDEEKKREEKKHEEKKLKPEPEAKHYRTIMVSEGTGISMPLISESRIPEHVVSPVEARVVNPPVESRVVDLPKDSSVKPIPQLEPESTKSIENVQTDFKGKSRQSSLRKVSFSDIGSRKTSLPDTEDDSTVYSGPSPNSRCPLCGIGKIKLTYSWYGWTFVFFCYIFIPILPLCLLYKLKTLKCPHCKHNFPMK